MYLYLYVLPGTFDRIFSNLYVIFTGTAVWSINSTSAPECIVSTFRGTHYSLYLRILVELYDLHR